MTDKVVPTIKKGMISVWPEGKSMVVDSLTPEGSTSYLNEQVLWIRHQEMADSRCLLRVPEGLGWEGKQLIRVDKLSSTHHHYQVDQDWRLVDDLLLYQDCPISTVTGTSPGMISTTVDVIKPGVVRLNMTVTNTTPELLKEVSAHFCLNHRRAPLLGRSIYARAEDRWVDFRRYHRYFSVDPEVIQYQFDGGDNPKEMPAITEPMLFSESVHESGSFISAIASNAATRIMSNIKWPCTDIDVDFGTVLFGRPVTRTVFVGLGIGTRDTWYSTISGLL